MYEVLKIWKFGDLKYVAVINDRGYPDISKRIGDKMDILISFVEHAYSNIQFYGYQNTVKGVNNNLYGKVFGTLLIYFMMSRCPHMRI